jgi:hypothetical protein
VGGAVWIGADVRSIVPDVCLGQAAIGIGEVDDGSVAGGAPHPAGREYADMLAAVGGGVTVEQVAVFVFSFKGATDTAVRGVIAELDIAVGVGHDVAVEVPGIRRAFDNILELLGNYLLIEVGRDRQSQVQPIEVVEAIAVHQPFHLVFKDGVEGGPEKAAIDVFLGETADPQVDVIESAGAIDDECPIVVLGADQEVGGVLEGKAHRFGITLGDRAIIQSDDRIRLDHVAVERIGSDEVR